MKGRDEESKKNTEKKDSANVGLKQIDPILSNHIDLHNNLVRQSSPEQHLRCNGLFSLYHRRIRESAKLSFDPPKSIDEVRLDCIHQSLSKCLSAPPKKS